MNHQHSLEITFEGRQDWAIFIAKAISLGFTPNQYLSLCQAYGNDYGYGHICMGYKKYGIQKYCRLNTFPCKYYIQNVKKFEKCLKEYDNLKSIGVIIDEAKM